MGRYSSVSSPEDDLPQPPRGVVRLEGHPLAVIGDGQTYHGFEPAEKDSVPGIGDDDEGMVDGLIEVILIVGQPGEIQVGPARGEAEIVSLRKRDQVVGGGFALGKVPGLPVDQHQTLLHANRPGIDPPGVTRSALAQPADGRVSFPVGLEGQSHTA